MWIQTREGYIFDLLQPRAAAIEIETIARVLSRKCRFGGHSVPFYSVAQHSCFVAYLVEPKELKLPALLHDAHEVYSGFGDVLRPAKRLAANRGFVILGDIERKIDIELGERFGFDYQLLHSEWVKYADAVALATEARDVMCKPPQPWEELPPPYPKRLLPLSMDASYTRFMRAFTTYTRKEF